MTRKYEGHTSEPWDFTPAFGQARKLGIFDEYDFDELRGSDGSLIAMGIWHNDSTAGLFIKGEANARLIADAPTLLAQRDELLTALKDAVGEYDAPCIHCGGKGKIAGSKNWVSQGYVEADCYRCGGTGERYRLDWMPGATALIKRIEAAS